MRKPINENHMNTNKDREYGVYEYIDDGDDDFNARGKF